MLIKRTHTMSKMIMPLFVLAVVGTATCEHAIASTRDKYATETLVYNFSGGLHGAVPYGQLSFLNDNLVGTTYGGGTGGQGIVFTLTKQGVLTTLHSFIGGDTDGDYVTAGVVADADGNLYGTTGYGGTSNIGIVYKLDTTGNLTVLHSFSNCADGGFPIFGTLVLSQGTLYGVTSDGRLQSCQNLWGTAFQINTDGTNYAVTNNFNLDTPKKGYNPVGSVALLNGSVYGTTQGGGVGGWGTVFQIDAAGKESRLYGFKNGHDGVVPAGGVILGADGKFYGTTEGGGKPEVGTVFSVDTTGKETVLHTFTGKHGEGAYPVAGLVQDSAGDLFGTTQLGGKFGVGTVFEVTVAGTFMTLHSFKNDATDGQYPFTGLVIDSSGDLYGTAEEGGAGGAGVVFKVTLNK